MRLRASVVRRGPSQTHVERTARLRFFSRTKAKNRWPGTRMDIGWPRATASQPMPCQAASWERVVAGGSVIPAFLGIAARPKLLVRHDAHHAKA